MSASAARARPRARSAWRVALGLVRLALAALLVLWALTRPGAAEALRALLARPAVLALLPCFGLAGAALEAARLACLVRAQGTPLSWRAGLRVVACGSFVNHALSGAAAGDLARLLALTRGQPGARVELATALLVDRVVALGSLCALVLGTALAEHELLRRSELARGVALALAAAVAVLALALGLALSRRVHARLAPPAGAAHGWRGALARASRALLAYRGRAGALLVALALSLAGHALLFGLILLEGALVAPDAPARAVLALTLLALVVNALPVTPGGLGVGEAASEALFASAGFAGGPAILLGWRAAQLPVVLLGALWIARGERRARAGDAPPPAAA